MNAGEIPNVMSMSVCERLSLTPGESNRRITTAVSVKSPVHGTLNDLPISFGHVVQPVGFLVIEGSSYELKIGRTTMRKPNVVIDCGKQCFSLVKDGEQVTIHLVYEYVRDDHVLDGGTTDSDFKSAWKPLRGHP